MPGREHAYGQRLGYSPQAVASRRQYPVEVVPTLTCGNMLVGKECEPREGEEHIKVLVSVARSAAPDHPFAEARCPDVADDRLLPALGCRRHIMMRRCMLGDRKSVV